MDFLNVCWGFVCDAFSGAVGLLETACVFMWDLLVVLHVQHPRIEGLLIGVSLAWLLSRRDSHPLLRAVSSPLKLVLDILDLAWDQTVEFVGDVWDTSIGWIKGGISWSKSKVVGVWSWGIGGLKSVRDKLRRKEDE